MSRLNSSTFFTNGMSPEQLEAWAESVKASGPVLRAIVSWLRREVEKVNAAMRLSEIKDVSSPGQLLLAYQAKKEAYEALINMLDN